MDLPGTVVRASPEPPDKDAGDWTHIFTEEQQVLLSAEPAPQSHFLNK